MSQVRILVITLFAVGFAVPLHAASATWDRNPESNVTGYRLSYGTQPGIHDVSLDVGNVVTYQFSPPPGRRYYVVVQAYNSSGALSPKSAEVMFDAPAGTQNQPPALTQPANQSSAQNTAASLQLVATDPERAALVYVAAGLPPGLTLNTSTGAITGTVTTVGSYTISATVSDGSLTASRTFTWAVTSGAATTVLLSPADTTINLDTTNYVSDQRLYTYTYPANRVANAILMKFDLSQIPANATIQSATLQLSLIEMDNVTSDPNYSVSLHQIINRNPDLSRATGRTADGVNNWTASTCCYQNIPLGQSDISPARAVTVINRTLGFKTWDALSLVQAWRATPSTNYGLLLNSDATKGSDRFRFFASMEHASTTQRPSLRVVYSVSGGTTGDTTRPTVSITAPANGNTVSGASVAVTAAASDAVGVVGVQFRLDGANLGAEDTAAPYTVAWNTTSATNASHVLTAVARDAAGNSATSSAITVTVNNVAANRAPVLTQPANQTSAEGSAVSLALSASDPDRNPLTFSATGLPGGLAVNATSGLITGTLSYTSAGSFTVTARVSDGPLSASRTFSWTITNTNRPPVLAAPGNQTSNSDSVVSLQLSASDPDGTAVTYQATGLPPGLTINASTGLITGRLTAGSVGMHQVTVTASDGATPARHSFVWSVDGADLPIRGDFDGDGRSDPATYRPASGEWRVWPSASNFTAANPVVWGASTDIPVPADYDGDRRTDIAVYRPSTGRWTVLLSSTNHQTSLDIQWGDANDQPLPLDYDNDGKADLALPRFGGFSILLSSTNYTSSVTVR